MRPQGVSLTPSEREQLYQLLHKGEAPVRVIKRAQVLSSLDKGTPPTSISEVLDVTVMTVYRIKWKFQKGRLKAALWEPSRPSKRKALDTRQAVSILAMACEPPPQGRARWTVRLLTSEAMNRGIVHQISREPIRRLLHDGELKPWREKNVVHQRIDAFLRGQNGGRSGSVRAPLESEGTGGLPG